MGKLAQILAHPDELLPMLRMYLASQRAKRLPSDPDKAFCYEILNAVSRSFAVVICQLPYELRDATCVFYLVLRALDTVEDDMGIDVSEKIILLKSFHLRIQEPDFALDYGTDHYQRLLNEFPKVHRVMASLNEPLKDVILNITNRMGHGMAKYIEKDVETIADFDEYCFFVAGLVGVGLSKLFASTGLETASIAQCDELSDRMGNFLQKTNIIRDYLEDIMEEPAPRMFWPKEVWGLYAKRLEEFKEKTNRENALKCLNHLIVDNLRNIPACFDYLTMIKTPGVFRFCAIPQIMSIATLSMCFDNGLVFEGVVKVRRGETCKIFESVQSMGDVYRYFDHYIDKLAAKIPKATMDAGVRERAMKLVQEAKELCEKGNVYAPNPPVINWTTVAIFLFIAIVSIIISVYMQNSS